MYYMYMYLWHAVLLDKHISLHVHVQVAFWAVCDHVCHVVMQGIHVHVHVWSWYGQGIHVWS